MKLTLALAAILVVYVAADSHDWEDVSRGFGARFALDFEENSMEVLVEGQPSGLLATSWYTKDFNPAGAMFFLMRGASPTIVYRANWCLEQDQFTLPSEVASAQTRRWKFTFYSGSLHVMCNGEEVLHLVFEEVCTGEDWREYWTTIPSYAQFDAMDQVSDKYRQADKPAGATDNEDETEEETEDETNKYTVIYTLWDDEDAPTTSSQYITIKGTNGQTEEYECNSENFRIPGAEVECAFESAVKLGNYRCLMLRTGGSDGLDFVKVEVYMNNDQLRQTVRASTAGRKYLTLDDRKTLEFCVGDCDDDAAKCSDGQQCVDYILWCNGEYDCQDWSDEKNCSCLEDDDLTGQYYKGNVSITASGSQCVNWESKNRLGSKLIKNYCRNPDDSDQPWCYTSTGYAYCDIPECSEVREDEEDNGDQEDEDDGEDHQEGGNGSDKTANCVRSNGEDYRGTVSRTSSGLQCQRWDSMSPNVHGTTPTRYPESGLEENYCRNPDGSEGPWCWNGEGTSPQWEFCDIPECDEVDCSNEENRYHHECTGDDSGDDTEIDCAAEENWDHYDCYAGAAQSQTICGVLIIAAMLFVGF